MSFNFLISSSGKSFNFKSNDSKEIIKLICEKIKEQEFLLINDKGIKMQKKNFEEKIFSEKNKEQNILIIPKNQYSCSEPSNEDIDKYLENQLLSKNLLDNYFNIKLTQISQKINSLNKEFVNFNNYINIIESKSDFKEFKNLLLNIKDEKITNQILNIEKKKDEFKKDFLNFKSKFKNIPNSYSEYKDIINEKINEQIVFNQDSIIPSNYNQSLNYYHTNKDLLDKYILLLFGKNEFIDQLNNIDSLQLAINKNYRISNMTINFIQNKTKIKEEIYKRICFSEVYNLLNDFLLTISKNEEKRRKDFINTIHGSFINYDNFINDLIKNKYYKSLENENEETMNKIIIQIKENINYLNKIINSYHLFNNENKNDLIDIETKNELLNLLSNNFTITVNNNNSVKKLLNILKEKTKIFENSKNIEFSFAECVKNDNDEFLKHNINNNNNINLNIEIFLKKYENIIFFYHSLFKFIQEYFIKVNKKELNNIDFSNPNSLAQIIQNIFHQNLKLKIYLNKISKIVRNNIERI